MKVYIIEFLADNSIISQTITSVTKRPYSHSGMFIDHYFCELDPKDKGAHYHMISYPTIKKFLKNNPDAERTHAFKIPHDFSTNDVAQGLKWWHEHQKKNAIYGFSKLFTFLWTIKLHKFYYWYYQKYGTPYRPIISYSSHVCSVACDVCVKTSMNFDIFPELDERIIYPGMYAKKYYNYKVTSKT